jgi:hypothetical protein
MFNGMKSLTHAALNLLFAGHAPLRGSHFRENKAFNVQFKREER